MSRKNQSVPGRQNDRIGHGEATKLGGRLISPRDSPPLRVRRSFCSVHRNFNHFPTSSQTSFWSDASDAAAPPSIALHSFETRKVVSSSARVLSASDQGCVATLCLKTPPTMIGGDPTSCHA